MSSMSMYSLPRPQDEKEFEKILMDYGNNVIGGIATVLGGKGQAQHGIDVVVEKDDGSRVCIQCKNYQKTKVTVRMIDNWIKEADSSPVKFKHFVIATSAQREAKLQEHVYAISDKRKNGGKFTVSIVFWEDIEHYVKKDLNLLRIYYPDFFYGECCIADAYENKNGIKKNSVVENDNYLEDSLNDSSIETDVATYLKEVKDKRPISFDNVFVFRKEFLHAIVKYRISEFLRSDILVGFESELLRECDVFEIELQSQIDRAIMFKCTDVYELIMEFHDKFTYYCGYLSTICQVKGSTVRYEPLKYEHSVISEDKEIEEAERIRHNVQHLLFEIAEWQ